ncbi:MAG: type VI secretion system ImpA family N-terminal domain-containing protein [Pseudomonadota bacterium]
MEIDVEAHTALIGEGPDDNPDLSDEAEFAAFEADVEGFLPSTSDAYYFGFRKPNADIDGFATRCLSFMERARDLRLVVMLAKLVALKGELPAAAACLSITRTLIETQWDAVQPQKLSSYNLRGVTVERLDEFASFVLPLQYAALVSDRVGNITWRDYAVATGAANAREGDTHPTLSDIERTLSRCDVDALVASRDTVAKMAEDLSAIGLQWSVSSDNPPSLAFKRLGPLLPKMATFLDEAVAKRDPSRALSAAAPGGESESDGPDDAPPAAVGAVGSLADAKAALTAASLYFEHYEPSSPALLLIRKSQSLMGLPFHELMKQLAPDDVPVTAIPLGARRRLSLPMEKLADEFYSIEIDTPEEGEPSQTYEAGDRAAAAALLQEVGRWYRSAEPSNPLPMLLDKARELMSKDFAALLTELQLPQETY